MPEHHCGCHDSNRVHRAARGGLPGSVYVRKRLHRDLPGPYGCLAFPRTRPTFGGTAHSREIAGMLLFEIYAFFGAPVILLLFAGLLIWVIGWQDRRDARRHGAAE